MWLWWGVGGNLALQSCDMQDAVLKFLEQLNVVYVVLASFSCLLLYHTCGSRTA